MGMAECSLDLVFFFIRDRPFFLVGGGGADFFQQLKLDFFFIDNVKVFLCNTIVIPTLF